MTDSPLSFPSPNPAFDTALAAYEQAMQQCDIQARIALDWVILYMGAENLPQLCQPAVKLYRAKQAAAADAAAALKQTMLSPTPPACAVCGQPVEESIHTIGGQPSCHRCFWEFPR